jgi:pyruvate dehydrogenase E2 component (dihydrolipoamide acetyltransferase)
MAIEVRMPRQGNTVESCLLVSWKKREGDGVSAGETLCEVETDKATFEVPAPEAGTLLAVLRKEGDDVPVLDLIAVIGAPGEDIRQIVAGGAGGTGGAAGAETRAVTPSEKSAGPAGAPAAFAKVASDPAALSRAVAQPSMTAPALGHPWPRTVSPRARRLADANGIDASALAGTGPGGRVIERDIRAALEGHPAERAAAPVPSAPRSAFARAPAGEPTPGPVTEVPVRGVRKLIAERMRASLSYTAQLTIDMSADATRILAYRAALKACPPERGLSAITVNDMVMFAAVRTLRDFPEMNAHFLGDRILRFARVHLGFAVDTPRGLIVPVIREADSLSLRELAAEARRLADAALSGKIAAEELGGGTFTVTNLGSLGVERFTPVLNPPQAAILGVCAILPRAVEAGGEMKLEPHIGLSLTIDHQAVDGAPAARFLSALCRSIARFDLLLAE